jgi:hypothetical protein
MGRIRRAKRLERAGILGPMPSEMDECIG